MDPLVTPLEAPAPPPAAFPSPFDGLGPHPLARAAALHLQDALRQGRVPGVDLAALAAPAGGKMFGVLAVQGPDGQVGFLRAFSGMLGGAWEVPGFVPPLFDASARAEVEVPGEAAVEALVARASAFAASEELSGARAAAVDLEARQALERGALQRAHDARRDARRERRAVVAASAGLSAEARAAALHALDQESRGDKAEKRRLVARHLAERAAVLPGLARLERRARALERLRGHVCRRLLQRIHATYRVPSASGESAPLRALYAPGEPPSGAADCAAPKLLAAALRARLRPPALAEFWWGAAPATGGRVAGAFYGVCKDKCGPLLPFMLRGLEVAPERAFSPVLAAGDGVRVLFEDAWLVVVEKPEGLLSVPGKGPALADSVLTRLRALHGPALMLAHRLDLDTSGLLVAAKDGATYRGLQRQFAHREVEKRYVAVLEGEVAGEAGVVELPLRVDLDDRPRQIVDPVHGLAARTAWRVESRSEGRTRVELVPQTGRTHQLRVHCSHPRGLGVPIVGDRLYGHPGPRLLLHAAALGFVHPATGARVDFASAAPF